MTPMNTSAAAIADSKKSDRNTKIGRVVSTKMAKTIIVETTKQRAHALYKRVMATRLASIWRSVIQPGSSTLSP